ncbi:hypothetical protein AX769_10000 [Frondihabitans sp. PAMC 28766]|uniref:GNAT family N-acetyltransferase n=1 Tax=Frondihabitans sp. PAMC 28766 TaxID=1795630 RepID=UPI00078D12D3|nr:GNAT family N-acetyltransferase [Frondihabitans sp. PAMC 28766]AMM20421.1 hypothetical protein AX769_10000 [Frondihabitans sp. PAMC 28766]
MEITVDEATADERDVLGRLLELYLHDLSEFTGRDVDEHGLFGYPYLDAYWAEAGRHPYFVRTDGILVGFALVRERVGDPQTTEMAEFFVLRSSRGQGAGSGAARTLLNLFPGPWRLTQVAGNTAATAFWRRLLPDTAVERVLGDGTVEHRFTVT